MLEKVKRSKTKYPGVYFNEKTKKYDVKYNFKVYNPKTGKGEWRHAGNNPTTLLPYV